MKSVTAFAVVSLKAELHLYDSPFLLLASLGLPNVFAMYSGADGVMIGAAIYLLLIGDDVTVVFRGLSHEQVHAVCSASKILMKNRSL